MRLVIQMIISEYNVTDNFVGLIVDGRRIVAEIETNDKKILSKLLRAIGFFID